MLALSAALVFLRAVSDRLHDLQRQRALAQDQVAWLDREIAVEIAKTESSPVPPPSAAPVDLAAAARRATHALDAALPPDAEKILAQYQTSPGSIKADVKKGCFLYVGLACVILAVGLLALYFSFRTQ